MTTALLSDLRVLVVEDEFLVLLMIEEMLADFGCRSIVTAPTVRQALAAIEEQSFDVAMLDVNLGGHMSFPVADALAVAGVPFLFATGYGNYGLPDAYRGRSVLRKPFQAYELGQILATLLA